MLSISVIIAFSSLKFVFKLNQISNIPHFEYALFQVFTEVQAGYRLPKPQHCPAKIYNLMMLCWWVAERTVEHLCTLERLELSSHLGEEAHNLGSAPTLHRDFVGESEALISSHWEKGEWVSCYSVCNISDSSVLQATNEKTCLRCKRDLISRDSQTEIPWAWELT